MPTTTLKSQVTSNLLQKMLFPMQKGKGTCFHLWELQGYWFTDRANITLKAHISCSTSHATTNMLNCETKYIGQTLKDLILLH